MLSLSLEKRRSKVKVAGNRKIIKPLGENVHVGAARHQSLHVTTTRRESHGRSVHSVSAQKRRTSEAFHSIYQDWLVVVGRLADKGFDQDRSRLVRRS